MVWAKRVIVAAVVIYMAVLSGLFVVMHNPDRFGRVMRHVPDPAFMVIPFRSMWKLARAGPLRLGEVAPQFTLTSADKTEHVSLSSFRGHKPVVLVFGSYT